jgi:hypothetical protein
MTLGGIQNRFDEYFSNVAHNTGIPPQYVKGQAFQEMAFGRLKEDNWRYEPCGADLAYVSGGVRKAFNDADFIRFRLDDAVGVTLQRGVRDDIDPRSRFYVTRPDDAGRPVLRKLVDADSNVTAREIWDNNNNPPGRERTHWHFDTGCQSDRLNLVMAANSTALDFVAQTPTATSGGLQQVMWDEAVLDDYWSGVKIGDDDKFTKAPKYLFDRPEYIAIGGGSVQLGLNKVVDQWGTIDPATLQSVDVFEKHLNFIFRKYNWWWRDGDTGDRYGTAVLKHSRSCLPSPPTIVFP